MDLKQIYKANKSEELIENKIQIVSFLLGVEEFGIDILNVQEIIKPVFITRVPNSSEFIDGVINLRGKIIPVINLRKRLDMDDIEITNTSRIIVVKVENNVVGFNVDLVNEVNRIDKNILEETPKSFNSKIYEFTSHIAKFEDKLIIFIDLQKLLNSLQED